MTFKKRGDPPPLGSDPLSEKFYDEGFENWVLASVGGAAIFSNSHKSFLSGIHRADSITWNAHKLLCVPLQCSLLLIKDQVGTSLRPSCSLPYLLASLSLLFISSSHSSFSILCQLLP
ncbi:Acidic amino acid decarboxylase GADL1 [Chionoecetes opilio]|uniref:Acidic amino acid decarboxylase GADL1 n=1 Tax=Chionoecetes opilio TaxID=41210 RepID=A0A8J4Y4S9_CHIOP|nr:Acidic amino acid decarboxylase GADL1 [Chionoecetes opilio]